MECATLSLRPKQVLESASTVSGSGNISDPVLPTRSKRSLDDSDFADVSSNNTSLDLAIRSPKRSQTTNGSTNDHSSRTCAEASNPPTRKRRKQNLTSGKSYHDSGLNRITNRNYAINARNTPRQRGLRLNHRSASSTPQALCNDLSKPTPPPWTSPRFLRSATPSPELNAELGRRSRHSSRLTIPPPLTRLGVPWRYKESRDPKEYQNRELRSMKVLWDETFTPGEVRMQVLAGLPAVVKDLAWEAIEGSEDEDEEEDGEAVGEDEDEFSAPEWARDVFGKP